MGLEKYITINIDDFDNATTKVMTKYLDRPEIMLLITVISSEIMNELFNGVVCDE